MPEMMVREPEHFSAASRAGWCHRRTGFGGRWPREHSTEVCAMSQDPMRRHELAPGGTLRGTAPRVVGGGRSHLCPIVERTLT